MAYDPAKHHRRSIRLKGYDYSQAGYYFITICCEHRAHLFGEIHAGKMALNAAGAMIEQIWHEIPADFPNIILHEYITMPNHIHGIIEIIQEAERRAEIDSAPTSGLSQIIQSFKRHTTLEYIKMVKQNILPPFHKRIWQRNYWEHIIRNEDAFIRISAYIKNNPVKWTADKLNGGAGNRVMESSELYNDENWMV